MGMLILIRDDRIELHIYPFNDDRPGDLHLGKLIGEISGLGLAEARILADAARLAWVEIPVWAGEWKEAQERLTALGVRVRQISEEEPS
jgi:hypothetical protein